MYRRSIPVWPFIVLVVAIIGGLFAHFATPNSKAIDAAETAGYTNVKIVSTTVFGVEVRGCGADDLKRFTVEGTQFVMDKDGKTAGVVRTFYVCAAPFKGGTVRSK